MTTVGRSAPFVRVYGVDNDGNEVAAGTPGELAVECPWLFVEYWNKPEATAEALDGNRYATGDIGVIDGHGYCYLTGGRRSEMIVSGGLNVYPVEVERVLLEHPAVADVAVFGRPDEKWGEAVTAAVQLHDGASVTQKELIAFTQGRIAGYKKPSLIHLVDDMPRTASSKIKKHELKAQLSARPTPDVR